MQILFTFNIKIPGAIIAFQGGMGKMDETGKNGQIDHPDSE